MKRIFALFFITIILYNCTSNKEVLYNFESETLKIVPISNTIFKHISYLKTDDFGNVACNGMIYFNKNEAIVFDTPTDGIASLELIKWIHKVQKKKIKAVVVTHFHSDCLGGLEQFHKIDTKSYANNKTIDLAKQNNIKTLPKNGFNNMIEIKVGKEIIFAKFFGEGHTIDNVVGYIPNEKTLFGGCLIKTMNASKGYLGDANTNEWSKTVEVIKKEIPDLNIIIPGHGKHGGTELLDYTIRLFKKL
ncbi:subclass B1 metallo-beta-lactamase [uncultured Lacinutrix sp.]|uniref:subclass B1 metallo-beta-lactamase n=1 Tax=uncultured Lacinutrix sp. TaxID=574032 RepID=UPI0026263857|nr:subclass B1 metallo-beta-lactamase [uncultured Lacinutrix sp.]